MQRVKLGGKSPLRIFLKGNRDLTDSLLSVREGERQLTRSLRDLVREKYQGAFEVEIIHESCAGSISLPQGDARCSSAPAFETRLFEAAPDVVVFSLQSEIAPDPWKSSSVRGLPPSDHSGPAGMLTVREFKENFTRLIRAIKERLDAHVIVYNCCPLDPKDRIHNHYGLQDPLAVRVHRFNLALMELSILEGISIIDVDRTIGELGGAQHVVEALRYSPAAYEALAREFLRVLEDIGFFEERPLLQQIGRGAEVS